MAVLSKVLNANGYVEFKIKKNAGKWELDIDDMSKPKYIRWGTQGDMDSVLLKIYNNQWENISTILSDDLIDYLSQNNNLRGDIAKILMTTKTGAEGITLKNVRQVNILERYWNYG